MFRVVAPIDLAELPGPPRNLISSLLNNDMHFVTCWQTEISVEHRDTKKAVSSFVEASTRSGMSWSDSDKSLIATSAMAQHK